MEKDIIIRYTVPSLEDYVVEYRYNGSQTVNIFDGHVVDPFNHGHNVLVKEVDIITFAERPSFDELLEAIAEHFSDVCDQVLADAE
jgi:hypothetical protein